MGYYFIVGCPLCGGELEHVNGVVTGQESTAVARCGACRREWAVTAYLTPLPTPEQLAARDRKRQLRHRSAVSA